MDFKHVSVLLNETIDGLNINPDGIYVDGTLGGGGHAYEVCKRLSDKGRLIGIDQDGEALEAAREHLKEFEDKITLVRSNYCEIDTILKDLDIDKVDGIVLDLGVSSYQLDNLERGFSYKSDAPLDMRMDQRQVKTAADVVNTYSENELFRIIRDYGEDKFAKNIAKHIVRARGEQPIETTGQLSEIIKAAIPARVRATGGHPAKRTFQAIRIAVNGELDALPPMLEAAVSHLNPGGRLAVISFHSLEDRIIKKTMQALATGCTCPPEFPVCVCGKKPQLRLVSRKPIVSGEAELAENPRARSAKLRVAEKL